MARTTRKSSTRTTRPQSRAEVNSEEKLSPEVVRALNKQYSSQSRPPFLLYGLILLLLAFSGYMFYQMQTLKSQAMNNVANNPAAIPTRPSELKVAKPDPNKDHWRGEKDVRYVWVDYSDLECPFCKRIHPDLIKIMGEYQGKLAWVFRHYPLPFHPKAQKSAEAVECANELGGSEAFWSMNDRIYDKMPDLELTQLGEVAGEVGLDTAAFQQCLDSGKYAQKVKDMLNEGSQAGVQATPTGVIYDMKTGKTRLVEGAVPYETLKQEIDTFMAQNK